MSGVSVVAWTVFGLWNVVLLYVFADIRRVMAFNSKCNAALLGRQPAAITDRGVRINRLAMILLLIVSNWLLVHFVSQWL